MITKYKIDLDLESGQVSHNLGYQLYGVLMQRLPPEICAWLHQDGIGPLAQHFVYDSRSQQYSWHICAFDQQLSQHILEFLQQKDTIRVEAEDVRFAIRDVSREQIASASELMLRAREAFAGVSPITITFLTPATFKQNGQYVLYPTVPLIVGNLINKWNALNRDTVIEDEYAVNKMMEGLAISHYKLQSARYHVKSARISGFVGELTLQPRLPEPLLEIVKLLFCFANYAGVGIKSALGMGGVSASAAKTKVRI